MLYYLSGLKNIFIGFNLFRYITFRAAMAGVTSFLLCVIFGPLLIKQLRQLKIREVAKRDDCPDLDIFIDQKEGTPTMGGIFIIGSILISVLLWADLGNRYILLTMLTCVWLSILGGVDDFVKICPPKPKKKEARLSTKRGLTKKTKLLWQIMIGCFIGSYVYFNPDTPAVLHIPFMKNFVVPLGFFAVPLSAVVVVGTSNAVNLTDGLDGLAIGCVLIVSFTLAILCYITGHLNFSQYLFLPFISGTGELAVFCMAIVGASLGFLWYNCHPATVFMGDVGSLSLGGTLGVIAVLIRKEALLALLGGVFVMEALSVILQILSVKFRGKRVFLISPLHHHFQMLGWKESKIIIRFWIVAIIFAMLTLMSLKIR